MAATANSRSEWVDYAKGLAILTVLFHHAVYGVQGMGIEPQDGHFWNQRVWLDFEPIQRVAIFFFLVGLFVERSFLKVGMKSFVTTRLRTLLYPYVLWQTISVARSAYSHHWSFADCLPIFLQMPFHGFQQFWFIATLLQAIAFYVLCHAVGLSRYRIVALSLCIYFLNVDWPFAQNAFGTWQNILPYFALGLLFGDVKQALGRYRGLWMPACGVALLAAMLVVNEYHWGFHPFTRMVMNSTWLAGLILISSFFAHFGRFQLLRLMGSYSLEIYCLHIFAGASVRMLLAKFGVTDFWTLVVVSIVLGIAVPLTAGICDRRFGWRLFRWQARKEAKSTAPSFGPNDKAAQETVSSVS